MGNCRRRSSDWSVVAAPKSTGPRPRGGHIGRGDEESEGATPRTQRAIAERPLGGRPAAMGAPGRRSRPATLSGCRRYPIGRWLRAGTSIRADDSGGHLEDQPPGGRRARCPGVGEGRSPSVRSMRTVDASVPDGFGGWIAITSVAAGTGHDGGDPVECPSDRPRRGVARSRDDDTRASLGVDPPSRLHVRQAGLPQSKVASGRLAR